MAKDETIFNGYTPAGYGLRIPNTMITTEIEGVYGSEVLKELGEIIKLYNVYEKGAEFIFEGTNGDYVAADLRSMQSAQLINKEARFLFSKHPDVWVKSKVDENNETAVKKAKADDTVMQNYVDTVFKKNNFFNKLLKACKDCLIGKRVACFINFDEEAQKVQISFAPSLEFVYEVDNDDIDVLTKIVCFFIIKNSNTLTSQRIYKKKYWLENGVCYIEEGIYDGTGELVEEITPARATKFTYIPAVVIRNDGLTGDIEGKSEIDLLKNFEYWQNKLNSADIDAERKNMNAVRYTVDISPESTRKENLSTAPGAYWDLSSDQAVENPRSMVGILESSMNYSSPLNATINRVKSFAYSSVDMPDTSPDAMQGVVTSGKTLKALYWGLIVRCDEKMQEWRPAIEKIVDILIDGAKLYPGSIVPYTKDRLPETEYDVVVDNQYSLPEDEAEEKQVDLAEVQSQTMSKRAYMKKWRNLTDKEVEEELQQIAREREILENSFMSQESFAGAEGVEDEDEFLEPEQDTEIEDNIDALEEELLGDLED